MMLGGSQEKPTVKLGYVFTVSKKNSQTEKYEQHQNDTRTTEQLTMANID